MSEDIMDTAFKALDAYVKTSGAGQRSDEMHLCGTGAVAELEEKLKQHYGMRYALCLSNATTGLLAIGLGLGLKRCEFVTTPYSYGASVAPWLFLGNKACFSDIDPETLTLDPEFIPEVLNPKVKAILSVDIFGNPADQSALRKVADEHGLWLISDAAQSLGAYRAGLPASSLADALVVSFTVGKSVFAGEGGAVLTNNAELYEKLVWYTQHPSRQRRELGLHLDNEFGLNGRIHPLAAIWANTVFDKSLRLLQHYRVESFEILDILNSSGWTQPIDFRARNIEPTFFRLSGAWKNLPCESSLLSRLESHGIKASLQSPPVRLLYKQPSLITQYRQRFRIPLHCYVSESQFRRRFCVLWNRREPTLSNFQGRGEE